LEGKLMTAPERVMRTMKYAFIISVLLFLVVTIRVPSNATHHPQRLVELIISLLAVVDLALGWNGRRFFAQIARANSRRTIKSTPLNEWFTANIFSLAVMESCALFALVLHFLGSSATLVGLLFVCALLALVAWNPGTPQIVEDASGISHASQ
jgi:hypothetical protein